MNWLHLIAHDPLVFLAGAAVFTVLACSGYIWVLTRNGYADGFRVDEDEVTRQLFGPGGGYDRAIVEAQRRADEVRP